MSRTLALLAALLLTSAARAQAPAAEPAKPADAPPPAAAKDAPAAAADKASCNEEEIEKHIQAAIDAMKASPANGHAGGDFKRGFTQLNAAKKSVKAGCAAYMKPPKGKGKGKGKPAPK